MLRTTFAAFTDELLKIAEETAFSGRQYKSLYGPKVIRRSKKFVTNNDTGSSSTLTNKDEVHHPVSGSSRALEGRETPGGPL